MFFFSSTRGGLFFIAKSQYTYPGSTTSTWSLKLILHLKIVLISTTKPPNMSFKLQVEVVEPKHGY